MTAVADLRAGLLEGRTLWATLRDEPTSARSIVVSGMLAEPLVRELGAAAEPGAVVARESTSVAGAEVLVRVIAADPSEEDLAVVRAADAAGVPVILVQLWPQADWTTPFVLTPFVVECEAGKGFPVEEIADRIVEAVEAAPALAARVPVLQEALSGNVRRGAVLRSAILGLLPSRGSTRPLLALEQARAIAGLQALGRKPGSASDPRAAAGAAALVLASGYVLRAAARATRGTIPAPLANAAIAAAGTWAISRAVQELQTRLPSS